MPEWLRALGYMVSGGNVPDNGYGLTPLHVLKFAFNVVFGCVIAGFIWYAVSSAMRNADIGHPLLIGFGAALVYAVVAVVYNIVNWTPPRGRF